MSHAIIDAMVEIDPPPCDDCPLYAKCAHDRIACWRFLVYADGQQNRQIDRVNSWKWQVYENPDPRVSSPSRHIYDLVYPVEDRPHGSRRPTKAQ